MVQSKPELPRTRIRDAQGQAEAMIHASSALGAKGRHAGQLSAFTVGGRLALGSFCQTSPFRLYFIDSTTADFSPNRIGRQPRPCGGSPAVGVLSVEETGAATTPSARVLGSASPGGARGDALCAASAASANGRPASASSVF